MRAAVALLLTLSAPVWACTPELPGGKFKVAEGKHYFAAWRTQPETVVIGQHFVLEVALCAREGAVKPEAVRVDAQIGRAHV